jgi:hypothetical protein
MNISIIYNIEYHIFHQSKKGSSDGFKAGTFLLESCNF